MTEARKREIEVLICEIDSAIGLQKKAKESCPGFMETELQREINDLLQEKIALQGEGLKITMDEMLELMRGV
jgi:hypothetical protein